MLNSITIMGRMTKDPELRYANAEKPVTSFTLAVERDGKNKGVDFIDCVAFDTTATFVSSYFKKGSMAVVNGRLQMRNWTDRDGNKRVNAEINAKAVYFGESKKSGSEDVRTYSALTEAEDAVVDFTTLTEATDGDLPF